MNFWIFGSNRTVIAYGKTPVIKAVSARWASLLVIDLNLGIKNFTLNNNVITCHKQKVATVISKYEFINNIFNPKPKPQPVNPIEIIETAQPEEPIIIEEIPEKEIKVEEIKVEEKVKKPKFLPHIVVRDEEKVVEPVYGPGFEVIIKPPVEQPEPIVEESTIIEEVKPEPVEEKVEEKVEEPKPKKKRKYTKRKKSNKE